LIVATTDPAELPELTTWYLLTNMPAPDSLRATESGLEVAEVAEEEAPPGVVLDEEISSSTSSVERGKRESASQHPLCWPEVLRKVRMCWSRTNALALLEGVLREAPAQGTAKAA
jgi:hypothetical protein